MKKFFLQLALLAAWVVLPVALRAQQAPAKNVVLILIDGYRWQELFRGADWLLLNDARYNKMDSMQRLALYWHQDLQERRKKLMPFIWSTIAAKGQLYGNRDYNNLVSVRNPYWISYPGRAELLSGFVDEKISSNSYGINTNGNVLEYLHGQTAFKNKVASFVCWGASARCLNKPNSSMLINEPWENLPGPHLTPAEILANEIQQFAPKTFGIEERLDFEVYALAKSYIMARHPRVVYIDFGDTDEYAHHGQYDDYLLDFKNLDRMIENLWTTMQQDKFYKNNTAFIIVPDHGRGLGVEWTSHGASIAHSNETWLLALGAGIKPLGEVKLPGNLYQTQVAASIARLLGFSYLAPGRQAGNYIQSIAP